MEKDIKNKLFKMIQDYLKPCPLIIWGSGATIPLGMPSMENLKKALSITEKGNLEKILSRVSDNEKIREYEEKIYKTINKRDAEFRKKLANDDSVIQPLNNLIGYFYDSHPRIINIITTNYDCVLEYVLSYYRLPYSDGFSGREFSQFIEENFKKDGCHINLYKVHGSLRWCKGRYSHYNSVMDAIFPTLEKYQKASCNEPYRTIISRADDAIKNAKCFLCIGFGFNDEHITPKIEKSITEGKKIVLLAKKATESTKAKLRKASNYMLVEKGSKKNTTQFSFTEDNEPKILEGGYWKIGNGEFNQVLMGANNHE